MRHTSALLPLFRAIVFTAVFVILRYISYVDLRFLKQQQANEKEEKEFGLFVDLLKWYHKRPINSRIKVSFYSLFQIIFI